MYAPPPKEERNPEQRLFSMALYMIAAFAGGLQCFNSLPVVVLGTLLVSMCFFMVKAQKLTAMNTLYSTHVEWTHRTLSIGSFFLFPLSFAVALYFVYTSTDLLAFKKSLDASSEGDIGDVIGIVKNYIAKNEEKVEAITSYSLLPAVIWWVRRCAYGFWRAKNAEPINFPQGIL